MRVIYVDSSVVVALMLEEADEKRLRAVRRELNKADEILSSNLLAAEVFSVAKREEINSSLASSFVESVSLVTPDQDLSNELQAVFTKGYVRGADAFHLATALFLDPNGKNLDFMTLDIKQEKLASSLGFSTC